MYIQEIIFIKYIFRKLCIIYSEIAAHTSKNSSMDSLDLTTIKRMRRLRDIV